MADCVTYRNLVTCAKGLIRRVLKCVVWIWYRPQQGIQCSFGLQECVTNTSPDAETSTAPLEMYPTCCTHDDDQQNTWQQPVLCRAREWHGIPDCEKSQAIVLALSRV